MLDRRALFFPCAAILPDPFEGLYSLPTTLELAMGENTRPFLSSYQERKKMTFISSWHLNEYQSDAMWRTYTGTDDGVAIQSTVSRLITSFPPLKEPAPANVVLQVLVGAVKYIDFDTEPSDWNNLYLSFLTKNKHFEHEREIRALIMGVPPALPAHMENGFYADVELDALIQKIFISPTAPDYYADAVKAICTKYGFGDRVERSGIARLPSYYGQFI